MQHSLVDPMASGVFDQLHPHIVFLGASGIDAERGVTNVNVPEAELKRLMIRAARRVVLLADGSKLGHLDVAGVCGIRDLDLLITGRSAAPEQVEALRGAGLEVLVAPDTETHSDRRELPAEAVSASN
jgi:DeoR family transcriptional regulator of aga operon